MSEPILIGSRGSDLALWQANFVASRLRALFPEHHFEIKVIVTTGDHLMDVSLSKIGDKGLFTRQIETDLLSDGIDLAVHSLKDLQTTLPDGLKIGGVCEREMPNDVLVSRTAASLDDLPQNAKIATGSLRRQSQLMNWRPTLKVQGIRGNVPTRLQKFDGSDLDGMVLAYAGMKRLGSVERVTQIIPTDLMLPAVGQGAIAVEIRQNDPGIETMIAKLDHPETRIAVTAERAFLRELEGGCQVPIGALAVMDGDELRLDGFVGSLDGSVCFRESAQGRADDAEATGVRLAEAMIARGARELLSSVRADAGAAAAEVL